MNRMVSFPSTPLLPAQISVDVFVCVCILRGPGILAFLRYVIKDTRYKPLVCSVLGMVFFVEISSSLASPGRAFRNVAWH